MWKQYIDQELTEMFMDRMFELSGLGVYDFYEAVKDVALSSNLHSMGLTEMTPEDWCDDCQLTTDLESQKTHWKNEYNVTHAKNKTLIKDMKDLETKMKDLETKMKNLKRNSVVFTMEDEDDS